MTIALMHSTTEKGSDAIITRPCHYTFSTAENTPQVRMFGLYKFLYIMAVLVEGVPYMLFRLTHLIYQPVFCYDI